MINYIKSELYRSRHNRSLILWTVILMALGAVASIALKGTASSGVGASYANTKFFLDCICANMNSLIFLLFSSVSFIDNNEYKNHTIKHSIAFGIPKSTIYIGRMLVQAIVCTIVYLLINTIMVGTAYAVLENSNAGELQSFIRASVACFPIFLGCIAIFQCLLMNLESPWGMGIGSVVLVMFIPNAVTLLSMKFTWLTKVTHWFYWNMAKSFYNSKMGKTPCLWDTPQGMRDCYLAGLVGVIVFTMIGITLYHRKEVK